VLRARLEDLSVEAQLLFDEKLESLCDSFGVRLAFPRTEAEIKDDRETVRMNKHIDAFLRRAARQMIKQAKRQTLAGKPPGISKTDWQKQKWPYAADEIAIGRTADLPRIRDVYHRLGKDEDFEGKLAAAYASVRAKLAKEQAGRDQPSPSRSTRP
jgi:hypothetical protein